MQARIDALEDLLEAERNARITDVTRNAITRNANADRQRRYRERKRNASTLGGRVNRASGPSV